MSTPSNQLAELIRQGQIAVTERRGADLVELSHDTMRRYRRLGIGPRYCRIGGPNGPIRYRLADLDEWLKSQSFASCAEEVAAGGAR